MAGKTADTQDVFDVANWLDRTNGRAAPQTRAPEPVEYVSAAYQPRHRADVPVDSVA